MVNFNVVTRIIIARHGNTFHKQQTPTRIGRRTDLPLVEEKLGINLGKYLKNAELIPTIIWAAPLQRTWKTAELAKKEMQDATISLHPNEQFLEIDYGPDENKTEEEVELRLGKDHVAKTNGLLENYTAQELRLLGKQIIDNWNKYAIVPNGWQVDPKHLIQTWINFANMVTKNYAKQTVMLVTSNGVIRFSPYLTGDFDKFAATHNIKVGTGNLCIFEQYDEKQPWNCTVWNLNPTQQLIVNAATG